MSILRTQSAARPKRQQERPFSTNNPFRNASLDSNINSVSSINQQNFNNWVRENQSQLSFSSDDEDDLNQMMPPPVLNSRNRPSNDRSYSNGSAKSNSSNYSNQRMTVPRRSSNNPFQDALSAESTGGSANQNAPLYTSNSNNIDYYNTDEKSRRRPSETEAASAPAGSDLPPSYEEVAAPEKKKEYPREKSGAVSSSRPAEEHRTRVNREWPGESTHRSSRERGERSERSERSERGPRDPSQRSSHRPSSKTHESSNRDPTATSSSSRRHESSREHRHESSREHRHESSREHRSRSSKDPHRSRSSRKKGDELPPKNVDTIDKLDVTGLFGGAFHHDGPFDACTPHRNKNTKSAPVLAFPADGPNNSIKGSGPIDSKDATLNYIQGRDETEDDLYSASVSKQNYQKANSSQSTLDAIKANKNITHLDSNVTANPVHGSTTLGLGSSTFLDGAPVAANVAQEEAVKSQLGRKKSLRQKLSPPSQSRTAALHYEDDDDQVLKFTGDTEKSSSNGGGNSLLKRVRSLRVGGRSRS